MPFYEVLENIMEEKSLSIPDVARMSGLSDSTVRAIINRKSKNASLEVAFKLSRGLDVSLERLNGEDENELTKKQSALENTKAEDIKKYEKLGQKLYETCLDAGLIAEGQELTRAESEFLYGLSTMLFSFFDRRNK